MRRCVLLVVLFAGFVSEGPGIAWAQASAPEAEIFGGVTKVWGHANGSKFDEGGGEVSATGYFNRVVGLEADFNTFSSEVPNAPAYGTQFSLLFGPHFAYRRNRWVNPFGHVLIGITRGSADGPSFTVVHRSAFTVGIGGGVDVRIWRFLWLRPLQIDYLRESFPSVPYPPEPFPRALENNLRLSFGFTLHLGSLRKHPKD